MIPPPSNNKLSTIHPTTPDDAENVRDAESTISLFAQKRRRK
jgi:hypothetical protein